MSWRTRGENCAICNASRGRVYTYDMWMSSVSGRAFMSTAIAISKVGHDYRNPDPDIFGTDLALNMNLGIRNSLFRASSWNPNWEPPGTSSGK